MPNPFNITEDEILDSLNRSGYLFESEITKQLAEAGFFVESNATVLDPVTGKSREIDLLAEYFDYNGSRSKSKVVAMPRFVFEIKNNIFPLVLLTRQEFSPWMQTEEGLKIAETIPEGVEYDSSFEFYQSLFGETQKMYTQYCSFTKKKANEELMAFHPDNIYSGLQKITHYCEEVVERWNEGDKTEGDTYLRNFVYLPTLLIHDDLYELEVSKKESQLNKVESSTLIFNYHYKNEPKTAFVSVVTKAGLMDFTNKLIQIGALVEEKMVEAKRKAGIALSSSE